jgi:hypothetical protein
VVEGALVPVPAPGGKVPVEIGSICVIAGPAIVLVEVEPSSSTSSWTHSPLVEEVKKQSIPPPSCVESAEVVVRKLDSAQPEAETITVWINVAVINSPSVVPLLTFSMMKVVTESSLFVPIG